MRRLVRRPLTVVALLLTLVGLVLLLPRVFAFYSATVTNGTSGTFYPTTTGDSPDAAFISCVQAPQQTGIRRGTSHQGNWFRCTNNWGTAVTINWSTVAGGTAAGITVNGSTLSIPAGVQGQCVRATITARNNPAPGAGTVRIRGTIDQSDLNAVIEVGAYFAVNNIYNPPAACT